jgi:hypothetical protein
MSARLPHAIHYAVTCPQFRTQLLADPEAAIIEHDLKLEPEDVIALKEVLGLITQHPMSAAATWQEPEHRGGWDGGPSFTSATIS